MKREALIALLLAILLGCAAAIAYAPTTDFPFVRYDDDLRLLDNTPVRTGLSSASLSWAFTRTWDATWSPITWLSHMLDFTLFANDAGGHHAVNLLLHALNVVLLFLLLRAASGNTPRSAAVALLLAIHPVHVESVAWVSERKGLLAATFGFASLGCYAADLHRRVPRFRTPSLVFLGLALGSKPSAVSLPFLLPLLERLGRDRDAPTPPLSRQLLSVWPWLVLAAAALVITLVAQVQAGSLRNMEDLPLIPRLLNALVTSALYVWKLVWPAQLVPFYPHPYLAGGTPWSAVQIAAAAAFWLAAGGLAWRSGYRPLRIGLLWYGITLLPHLGLLQTGAQGMADRYLYLPAIGVYLAVVWGAADALRGRGRAAALAGAAVGASALLALAVVGQRQIQVWRSSESLFRHAVEVSDGNFSMHFNLANTLKGQGEVEEAIEHYRKAVAIHPEMARAHYNLANTLLAEERIDEAIVHYRAAARARPDLQLLRDALGQTLIRAGDLEGALAHFREEVQRRPDTAWVRITYANLLRAHGDLAAAADAYEAAARVSENGARWEREAQALRAQLGAATKE